MQSLPTDARTPRRLTPPDRASASGSEGGIERKLNAEPVGDRFRSATELGCTPKPTPTSRGKLVRTDAQTDARGVGADTAQAEDGGDLVAPRRLETHRHLFLAGEKRGGGAERVTHIEEARGGDQCLMAEVSDKMAE